MTPTAFRLKVRRIDQSCVFDLSWGQKELTTMLLYPESLTLAYQTWQRAYLNFYKAELRARVEGSGSLPPPMGWRSRVIETESKLLTEFYEWLESPKLAAIRKEITEALLHQLHESAQYPSPSTAQVDLFLTCEPLDLARLPWEAWELGGRSPTTKIRIARTSSTLPMGSLKSRQGKARILVMIGDEKGLNFQADLEKVKSLAPIADIQFVGWQPGQKAVEVIAQLEAQLIDQRGWDILIFIGHSNESVNGGELAIAPGESIFVQEIAQSLKTAKDNGLQFAIFNSCCGLNIADSLMQLGLSQVAIMREPIHNQVAQDFLAQFLQELACFKDVHDALQQACQHLKLNRNLTYPSAYLVPSLFRHPDTSSFILRRLGWRPVLQQLLPTRLQTLVLLPLLILSCSFEVQGYLLNGRLLVQAIYRQVTHQLPTDPPAVALIQIDDVSIVQSNLKNTYPMDRGYLADLVNKLTELKVSVIGLDYLLDRPSDKSPLLSQAIKAATTRQPDPAWVVLAAVYSDNLGQWLDPLPEVVNPNEVFIGHIETSSQYMPLENSYPGRQPFTYQLALAQKVKNLSLKQPSVTHETNQLSRFAQILHTNQRTTQSLFPDTARLQPITALSYSFRQLWLHPIIDYSIPPDRVYQSIPAWKLLQATPSSLEGQQIQQQVVIVAAAYAEAGVKPGEDNIPMPAAVQYWLNQQRSHRYRTQWTGGELNAYATHHWLKHRLVVPIPDLWLAGLSVLLGQILSYWLRQAPKQRGLGLLLLGSGTLLYGLLSLQLYISAALLFPWLFPSAIAWASLSTTLLGIQAKNRR